MLEDRHILLILTGGIAAYKSLELIRRLRERGAAVQAIMTRAAQQFVTPLSVASLTGNKVYTDLFNLTDEAEMGHIQLSRSADLIVIAPASANFLAQMAQGTAQDLASSCVLASDTPVLVAPAMNVRMWLHPATRRSIEILKQDGVLLVGPVEGDMACGEYGPGRMAEPADILAWIEEYFSTDLVLAGKKALVTAGPTFEPIDPVRYIANRSSGKQGYATAGALAKLGAETTLVSGPVNIAPPAQVTLVQVETAADMLAACEAALPVDIGVFAAAVADWSVTSQTQQTQKIKKTGHPLKLVLQENPDILAQIAGRSGNKRPALVVGFAAETENVVVAAQAKRVRKGCDWMVANDVSAGTGIMGGDDNQVHLITDSGVEDWPKMSKAQVAAKLAARIGQFFQ